MAWRRRATKAPPESSEDYSAAKTYPYVRERYIQAAKKARRAYHVSETLLLVIAATIPASAVFTKDVRVPAVLGGLVVVITGLRSIFGWRDNWLRYSEAIGQLEIERVRYQYQVGPYSLGNADALLAETVKEIELSETQGWVRLRRAVQEGRKDGN
jgi:hypothetical protein